MATLFNTKISDTYEGLIKTSDNGVIGAVEKNLTDGLGNTSTLSIGTSTASFTGTLDLTNATVVGLPSGAVDSVNGQTGVVVLTTTNINEGTNLYFTDARVEANSAVALNTAKVGITPTQANEIAANTLKVGITTQQSTDITNNNAKISFDSASSTKLNGIEAGAQVNTVNSVNSLTGAVSLGLLELDDVGSDGSNGQVLTTNGSGSFTFTTVAAGGAVDSVNGQTGTVVLDTNNINEGTTNLYYTDARVSANSSVSANTAKVGITSQQATDITNNNAKVGITTSQANEIAANTLKVGITPTQASDITTNNSKVGITTQQASDITTNNAKVGITTAQANEIAANTLKVGITTQQASDITTNNSKVSMVLGTTAGTALAGNTTIITSTSPTVNTVPKYDSNGNLVNSSIVNSTGQISMNIYTYFDDEIEVNGQATFADYVDFQGTTSLDSAIALNTAKISFTSTGTDNYLSKWSSNTLIDSLIYDNGTNVGIGTTTPSDKLSVVSTVGILGDSIDQGLLKLYCEDSSHYVGIQGPNHSGGSSYTLQLPNALPNVANQILESNATGTLSWIATPSGGGGSQIKSYHFCSNHSTNSTSNYYQFRSNSPNSMTGRNISWTSWNYQYWTDLIMASNCFLKTVIVRSLATTWSSGLQVKMRIYKNSTVLEYDGSFVTSTGSGNTGNVIFNLTDSDTSFLQGDVVAIGFNATSTMGGIASVMDFETT